MIEPFNQKSIPYIIGQPKTFLGFTSATPKIKTSYSFLGEKNDLKRGTIFTLFGDICGYDITLFNYNKFYIHFIVFLKHHFLLSFTKNFFLLIFI